MIIKDPVMNFEKKLRTKDEAWRIAWALVLQWEISNANTNPWFPSTPVVGDTYIITTNPWTVWWLDVEIGDQLIYSTSWWFVLQANLYIDTDWTLAADSDWRISSQKAVKTYVDTNINANKIKDWTMMIDNVTWNYYRYNWILYKCNYWHPWSMSFLTLYFDAIKASIKIFDLITDLQTYNGLTEWIVYLNETNSFYKYNASSSFTDVIYDNTYSITTSFWTVTRWEAIWWNYNVKLFWNQATSYIKTYSTWKSYIADELVKADFEWTTKIFKVLNNYTSNVLWIVKDINDLNLVEISKWIGYKLLASDLTTTESVENDIIWVEDMKTIYKFEPNSANTVNGTTFLLWWDNSWWYPNPVWEGIAGASVATVDQQYIYYVWKHWSDINTWLTIDQAFLTFEKAIDAYNTWIYAWSYCTIRCVDNWSYTAPTIPTYNNFSWTWTTANVKNLEVPQWVNIDAPNIVFTWLITCNWYNTIRMDFLYPSDYSIASDYVNWSNVVVRNWSTWNVNVYIWTANVAWWTWFWNFSGNSNMFVDCKEIKLANVTSWKSFWIWNGSVTTFTTVHCKIWKILCLTSTNWTCWLFLSWAWKIYWTVDSIEKGMLASLTQGIEVWNDAEINVIVNKMDVSDNYFVWDIWNNAKLRLMCNDFWAWAIYIQTWRTGQEINVFSNNQIYSNYLKTIKTHPTNYKSIYVNTDTWEVYSQAVPASSGWITWYDATVAPVWVVWADYNTIWAAYAAWKRNLLVYGDWSWTITETLDLTLTDNLKITNSWRNVSSIIDFTTKKIDFKNYNLYLNWLRLKYTYTVWTKFISTSSAANTSWSKLIIKDVEINNTSTVANSEAVYIDWNDFEIDNLKILTPEYNNSWIRVYWRYTWSPAVMQDSVWTYTWNRSYINWFQSIWANLTTSNIDIFWACMLNDIKLLHYWTAWWFMSKFEWCNGWNIIANYGNRTPACIIWFMWKNNLTSIYCNWTRTEIYLAWWNNILSNIYWVWVTYINTLSSENQINNFTSIAWYILTDTSYRFNTFSNIFITWSSQSTLSFNTTLIWFDITWLINVWGWASMLWNWKARWWMVITWNNHWINNVYCWNGAAWWWTATITINAGATSTRVIWCVTDAAIVDNWTTSVLANNVVF